MRFYRIYIEMSHLGHNVIKRPFKWKSKRVRTSLTSTIEILREEVGLSNTCTASVMHIPNTLSLTSARNDRKQKFQKLFSSVNFIVIMLLRCSFYGGHLVMRSAKPANHLDVKQVVSFILLLTNDRMFNISFLWHGKTYHGKRACVNMETRNKPF